MRGRAAKLAHRMAVLHGATLALRRESTGKQRRGIANGRGTVQPRLATTRPHSVPGLGFKQEGEASER